MTKLNQINQPYFIQNDDVSFKEPLNTLDCLRLHIRLQKLKNGKTHDQKIYLPSLRMEIDLTTKEAKLDGMINRKFKLVKCDMGFRQRDS